MTVSWLTQSRNFFTEPTMPLARKPRLLCLVCQWRSFSTSYRRLAQEAPKPAIKPSTAPAPRKPAPESPLENAPRAYGERVEKFTPVPLPRPIGLTYPPQPGQNTGIDNRSIRQRRDDFVNWDKHLERREELYVYLFLSPTRKTRPSRRFGPSARLTNHHTIAKPSSVNPTSATGRISSTTRARPSSRRRDLSRAASRSGSRTCMGRRC